MGGSDPLPQTAEGGSRCFLLSHSCSRSALTAHWAFKAEGLTTILTPSLKPQLCPQPRFLQARAARKWLPLAGAQDKMTVSWEEPPPGQLLVQWSPHVAQKQPVAPGPQLT